MCMLGYGNVCMGDPKWKPKVCAMSEVVCGWRFSMCPVCKGCRWGDAGGDVVLYLQVWLDLRCVLFVPQFAEEVSFDRFEK